MTSKRPGILDRSRRSGARRPRRHHRLDTITTHPIPGVPARARAPVDLRMHDR
jgi:hypothetical protein